MPDYPYFPFYPGDWLADEKVQSMSWEARGVYIHLLAIEWREGSIPADSTAIALLCMAADSTAIGQALTCFKPCPRKKDRLFNPRLESERKKLETFRNSKKQAGLRGAERRWHSHSTPTGLPLAKNASLSSSSSSNIEEKNTPYIPLSEFLKEMVQVNVPFQKIPANYRESWANEFRLMTEVDKIPIERIREVLEWATADSFWKINIRSAAKFREKFGALEAKSRSKSPADIKQAEVTRALNVGNPAHYKFTPEQEARIPAIKKEYADKLEKIRKEKGLASIEDIDPFEIPNEFHYIRQRLAEGR